MGDAPMLTAKATGSAPITIETGDAIMPAAETLPSLEDRTSVTALFSASYQQRGGFLDHAAPEFMHGALYNGPNQKPKVLWKSDKQPRKDHDAASWLTATEFEDVPAVLAAKAKQLAQLMRFSKRTVVYSGAGISAAVVGQAALSGQNKVGWTGAGTSAQPTPTHYALARLGRTNWIHGWVQQNHDGLPQKAGFPQERICEIHGSWYDPANPVVKYSGSLKAHECEWMEREAAEADLVLVMGTSLGGLNADQVATECASRAASGASLGSVIINLQQTEQDGKMSIKVSARTDDFLALLLRELGLELPDASQLPMMQRTAAGKSSGGGGGRRADAFPSTWSNVPLAALVPYDAKGARLPEGSTMPRMWLDLRPGAKVALSKYHNHQGAKQPNTIHIGARKGQKFNGKELLNIGRGIGAVVGRDDASCAFKLNIESAPIKLGLWWMEAAVRGGPELLPVVNSNPSFEDTVPPGSKGAPDEGIPKTGSQSAGSKLPTAKAARRRP